MSIFRCPWGSRPSFGWGQGQHRGPLLELRDVIGGIKSRTFEYVLCEANVLANMKFDRNRGKKNSARVSIFGDRPGSKNRNRRDLEKKKIFEKKNFWLVLEWVTPSGTHFVLKFRFRAQLSEMGKKKFLVSTGGGDHFRGTAGVQKPK